MKKLLKEKFGLTDSGVKAVQTASFISMLVNFAYMSFMLVAMHFGDQLLKGIDKPAWYYLILLGITLVFAYLLVDLEYVRTYNATYKEACDLRLEIADRIRDLPLSYFSRHDLSDLAQTIMQDVLDIEHAMSHAMPRCIGYAFFLIVIAVLLLISNLRLGLATILPLLFGFSLLILSKNRQKTLTAKHFWKTRETSEAFQETIELQREIKSCGLQKEHEHRVSEILESSEKLRIKSELTQAVPLLLSLALMKLSLGVVSLVGAALLSQNAVELIFVIGFLLASVRLVDAVAAIEESFAELFYLDARVKRLNEVRNTAVQQGEKEDLRQFDVELEDVCFSYDEDTAVVNGVSFTARQNEVTAIVGPSGCGKSTLLRLISRLYDYKRGQIRIGGKDIKNITTDSLFDKVSFVFQDVILFNASVLENIRMGRPDASDEEVIEAARLANCSEFIEKLPQGYDSLIGENGSRLSGGERQRLSIARAFLKNAPILLLDEISASLDVENEMKIQTALNQLIAGKTVIIVSHRLKSIEKVNKIIVMEAGKIESMGSHAELLKRSSLYPRLLEKSKLTENFSY